MVSFAHICFDVSVAIDGVTPTYLMSAHGERVPQGGMQEPQRPRGTVEGSRHAMCEYEHIRPHMQY